MNARSCRKGFFWAVILGSMSLAVVIPEHGYTQNAKKVGQLNFQLPEDWPVEKRGGLMTPIPTEEYVSIKFKEIKEEFRSLRDELSEKFTTWESHLKRIEADFSEQIKKGQPGGQTEESPGGNLGDILSDIELLKSELGRLDRKITNKIKEMQGELERGNPQIESIKENLGGLQTQIYRLEEKVDYLQEDRSRSY